jgi:hypothetical protein
MRTARLLFVPLFVALVVAHATEPRQSAQEYPAHVDSPAADIGVDFMVHSFSDGSQMYYTKDYLVFDVAVYPKAALELTNTSFELRINYGKRPIPQVAAELVADSLRNPDWLGQPQAAPGGPRYPAPPHVPEDVHKPAKINPDAGQIAVNNALKSARITAPTAGNIYFQYAGNIKKVNALSLVFHAPSGDVVIPIR